MKKGAPSARCSGGTGYMRSSLFRMARLKPASPLASQGCPTRKATEESKGRHLPVPEVKWYPCMVKKPRFEGIESISKQDSGFYLGKALQQMTEQSAAGISGRSCVPHISNQYAKRRLLCLALFQIWDNEPET